MKRLAFKIAVTLPDASEYGGSEVHGFSTDSCAEFCFCMIFVPNRTKRNGQKTLDIQGSGWWAREGLNL